MNALHSKQFLHAGVLIDQHSAKIVRIDATHVLEYKVTEHLHLNAGPGGNEHSRQKFYGRVYEELKDAAQVLVVGRHEKLPDFHRYVDAQGAHTALQTFHYQTVESPFDSDLMQMTRTWFSHISANAEAPV